MFQLLMSEIIKIFDNNFNMKGGECRGTTLYNCKWNDLSAQLIIR